MSIKGITERDFQSQIEGLFKLFNWRYYHTWQSKHSAKGFPDYTAVRDNGDGKVRLLFSELKSDKGKLTKEQAEWLWLLRKSSGAYIWRPRQFDRIVKILANEDGGLGV